MNSKTKDKKVPLLDARTLQLPVDVALATGFKKITEKILRNLEPKEAELLRLRFGIGGCKKYTLAELSTKWGVSAEKLRDIEAKALWHLRKLSLATQHNDSKKSVLRDVSAISNEYRLLQRSLARQRIALNRLLPISCDKQFFNKLYLSLCVAEELLEEIIACTKKYSILLEKQRENTRVP